MRPLIGSFLVLFHFILFSQEVELKKIEPPYWWVGMKNSSLQLLVYGIDISKSSPEISYPGVRIKEIKRVENPNYLFIYLDISNEARAGNMNIQFRLPGGKTIQHNYALHSRKPGSAERNGFNSSDVFYLLMPDRFSNGDTTNDNVEGMMEKANRTDKNGRHGGDIKGIVNRLPYFSQLGVTALWVNPLLENNNPVYSYHGYAITDFYRIDPRFGTNDDYVDLVSRCHDRKIKVIKDMVFNHASVHHWFIKDLPASDWIHQFDEFTRSNFRAYTVFDDYASKYDRERMLQGWFDHHMADLDQRNTLLAQYIIQNTIWWIELSGIDGIRLDTQPYSYKEFVSDWAAAVFDEYPSFNIVGEAWLQKEPFCAYFQKDAPNRDGYNSNIPVITDFPLYYAISNAFNEKDTWTEGIARFYYVFAQDYLYANPQNLLIFADNHDLDRIYSSLNKDFTKWKMAMATLLTARGIPCIYYGTEILMEGLEHSGHGFIREDFPGGWHGDPVNAFERSGRTSRQQEAFAFLQKLIKWRNGNPVIHNGKFTHFIPENNTYVFFRHSDQACTMVAFNNSPNQVKALHLNRFNEMIAPYNYSINVITGSPVYFLETITIPPKSVLIMDFKK
jgi:neopullulanase